MADDLRASLTEALPEQIAVGAGSAFYLEGTCETQRFAVASLFVSVGENESKVVAHGMPPQGAWRPLTHWWAVVRLAPVRDLCTASVALRAELRDGTIKRAEVGEVKLLPGHPTGSAGADPADGSQVAVAMATYEPPPALFQRQIDSIRAQTHDDWTCVISDDGSSEDSVAQMRAVLGDDPRFRLFPSQDRLGVYGNFERALNLIPSEVGICAFCDQDDYWYPRKLERLVAQLGPSVHLAYSDSRIVSTDGDLIADTYWTHRRNNYSDLGALLLANTVTGAASVFTRELLTHALPFPPRYRDAYHDHWMALCALALGRVSYIDEPLYDYVQHAEAVIGFEEANLPGEKFRRRRVRHRAQNKGISIPHLVYSALRRYYFSVWCQSMVWATALEARCGAQMSSRNFRTVSRLSFENDHRLLLWLASRSLRPRLSTSATFGRERYVLMALVWRRLVTAWAALTSRSAPG